MTQRAQTGTRTWLIAASLTTFAGFASAQGLMSTSGVVVATEGDAVPDANGVPIPGFTFGGSSALTNNPVLDESGNILFLARFQDSNGTLMPFSDKAFFYGSSRANLKLVVQGGDQAPGLPAGILLRTTTGTGTALGSSPRLSPDGRLFWGSTLYDGGVTVTSANDSAIFGGFFGAQTEYVRKGDVAPGTGGATFAQAFNSPSQQSTGINRNGFIHFQGTLVTGTGVPAVTTTTGMNNQAGLWAGLPGALELVVRKSSPVSGLGGAVAIDTASSIGFVTQMNSSNKLLYDVRLSLTQGSPMATAADDQALMVFTPGAGSQKVVREGDVAPGTLDPVSMSSATFNSISVTDSWTPGQSANCFNRSGETLFSSELRGGDVVAGVNDRALFAGGVGTLAMVSRRGDPAPGTDGVFSNWNVFSLILNSFGQICCQGILEGGTTTSLNDTGVWAGAPGSLALVLREGDTVPGTGGSIAGGLAGTSIYFNDQGQVLFNVSLDGGTITGSALYAWDAVNGLYPVVLPGDQIELSPGVFGTASGFGGVQFNNGDGAAMHFGHDGTIGLRIGLLAGGSAIMVGHLQDIASGTPFCFGDGSGTACPCGNAGAAGNGCASSVNANGGNLAATGIASLSSDSFVLHGTGLVNTSGLYFQGTTQVGAGAGSLFGDGLRCAGGTVVRLGTKVASGGASQYPAAGDPSVSVKGAVAATGTRTYQLWYRNAGLFCTPSTFNLTNGLSVSWSN